MKIKAGSKRGAWLRLGYYPAVIVVVTLTGCVVRTTPVAAIPPSPAPAATHASGPAVVPAVIAGPAAVQNVSQPAAKAVDAPPAAATANTRAVENAAPANPATVSSTPAQPVLVSADPSLPSEAEIRKRLSAVRDMDARIASKPTAEDVEVTYRRIQNFLQLADEALTRKDLRQADSLSSRAEVLAKDLLGSR